MPVKELELANGVGRRCSGSPRRSEDVSMFATVQFCNLTFLLRCDSDSNLLSFKKRIISRIGRHFYPDKQITEDKLDIRMYDGFTLNLVHGDKRIMVESNEDFNAAKAFFGGKMDVIVDTRDVVLGIHSMPLSTR